MCWKMESKQFLFNLLVDDLIIGIQLYDCLSTDGFLRGGYNDNPDAWMSKCTSTLIFVIALRRVLIFASVVLLITERCSCSVHAYVVFKTEQSAQASLSRNMAVVCTCAEYDH